MCDKTFHLCKKVNNNNLTHQQRMRCTQGSHLWSCNGFVTLWLIDWIGLEVDLHMHMYCRGCTCISYWAWTWAWDWAPLSRSCRGQCRCTSALTATIYCSPNNTLVKIPNPGNSRYTDYFSVYRLRWQPWVKGMSFVAIKKYHSIEFSWLIQVFTRRVWQPRVYHHNNSTTRGSQSNLHLVDQLAPQGETTLDTNQWKPTEERSDNCRGSR